MPCQDHHVHYHHEPKIQSKAASSELSNQNLKLKNTIVNSNSCSKRIYNHHLNFIEKHNKARSTSSNNNNKMSSVTPNDDGKLQL